MTQNRKFMCKAGTLTIAVAVPFLLGGCVAAAIPMLVASGAASGYGVFKAVQTSTGGSIEVAIDDKKLTNEQKAQLANIKSIAVWPDKDGGSVTFAEALSEGGRFVVISPAHVSSALKKLALSDDLQLMTTTEAKDVFLKVCQETNADSLISDRATGGDTNTNMWSFKRANITRDFLVSIYEKTSNSYIAEIPVSVKVLVGGKMPSNEEISKLANTEVAKKIIALAQNSPGSQVAQKSHRNTTQSPQDDSSQTSIRPSSDHQFKPVTTMEIQRLLLALGYQPGTADGVMGKRTVDALKKFQQDNNLPKTGQADYATIGKLRQKIGFISAK